MVDQNRRYLYQSVRQREQMQVDGKGWIQFGNRVKHIAVTTQIMHKIVIFATLCMHVIWGINGLRFVIFFISKYKYYHLSKLH